VRAFICSAGSEPALAGELERAGLTARQLASGVVAIEANESIDPVFARQALPDATIVDATSVRALAEAAFAATEAAIDRWPGPFTLHALAHAEPPPGLGSRAVLIGRELAGLLAERRRRAWRRHRPLDEAAAELDARWLLIQIVALGRDRLVVSAAAPQPLPAGGLDLAPWPGGDAPVEIDRAPPSRAYQKLEEAWAWMGTAPRPGQLCVDLGAAPGGWTATALKRGARVLAVDRAPLEPPVSRHPNVTAVISNAFTYAPPAPVDWLLCDVVCEPPRSLAICDSWLSRGLCRNLVVTVKFKGRAGYGILGDLPAMFARHHPVFARTKQLAHNKNEVTILIRK
jgi:23S rRNA (cytidine2498-2'-O)-methyltransferase